MGHSNHGVLAVLFYWVIFNNLDAGLGTLQELTNSSITAGNSAIVLSHRPKAQDAVTSDSLIWYKATDAQSFGKQVTSLETFLHDYRLPGTVPHRAEVISNCAYDQPPPPGKLCDVDVRHWHPCIAENYFGYHRSSPCVFLTLDTPVGWKPEFYNDTNSLPDAMPSELKDYIRNLATTNPGQLNTVWVSCEGQNSADKEFIGSTSFIPRRGFPGYYFLNNDVPGYLSPLVALSIERPSIGVLINIRCKAWARNINHNNDSGQGVGHFELLID